MRVLVTGGTGYLGAFTVKALLDADHSVRLLVRAPERVALTVGALGVTADRIELAVGDMTDPAAVAAAVRGVDAVIHCAAVVAALNRTDAQATVQTNLHGTRTVIDAALAAGCDPVIHTSSIAALYDPHEPVIHADLPPAVHAQSPYTRAKALCEQYCRDLQADGRPVVIVYPGGVAGPAAGPGYGELAHGFVEMLRYGVVPLAGGAFTLIDVRDLAAVMVAALEPGQGPRRFMAGGELIDMREVGRLLREVTGRRMPVIPLPGIAFRVLGRVLDAVRTVVLFDTVYTAEAMDLLTLAKPSDDTAAHRDLGVTYRPPAETVRAMVDALVGVGAVTPAQAGR